MDEAKDVAAQSHAADEPPEEIMVGKSDELDAMKDLLISGSTSNNNLEVVAVHSMGRIGFPSINAQVSAPAPAPTSDGVAIDQGIAYVLMLVALAITYMIH
nr:putative late blight resistance protein homolog R1A-4 [Ipomoea trifida]